MKLDSRFAWKLFDAVPQYILLFDCNGNIKMANQVFLDAVAIGNNEITDLTLEDLEPYYDMQGVKEQFAELKKQGSLTCRTQLVDNNGRVVPVEQTLVHIEDEGLDCILSIGHDISELIREKQHQEIKLRKAEDAVETANRLKSEFIANMNHEIRTPMNAIIGYSEMLSASNLGEREQRFVKTICKNGATLISILNDVMELFKLDSGAVKINKKSTNLQALVDEVVGQFTDWLPAENINFSCTFQPGLPDFFVLDDNHCRHILTHLLKNAVKFTNRGKVSLAVTGMDRAADCVDLSFSVTDTGVGITDEEQKCLVALFEQHGEATEQQSGERLGLTLCARLALMMEGRISLESEQGQGSTFIFRLPAQPVGDVERRKADPEQHLQKPDNGGDPPVLLVVDDMPMISAVICDYFARYPVEVLVADNSEDGLALARSRQPDLILMDLSLSGLDGREATRLLKDDGRTANIPVVVMTGRMLDEDDYKPLFDDFLAKPFHLNDLQRVVDRFIRVKDRRAPTTSLSRNRYPPEEDARQIRAVWDEDLAALLDQALVSGSLDAAFTLGLQMYERGEQLGLVHLMNMGKLLKDYAAGPDILGVEQLLAVLQKCTGESS